MEHHEDDILKWEKEAKDLDELKERFQQLVKRVENDRYNDMYHEWSGYSMSMARRGVAQLRRFAKAHPEALPEDYEMLLDHLSW